MFTDRSVGLSGCQNCAYKLRSQEEAAHLLQNVIKQAHMQSIDGGGLLLEARLDERTVIKLCLWSSGCEDCEEAEHMGDGPEPVE